MTDLDLKDLWQTPSDECMAPYDIDEIIAQANAFDAKVRRRNMLEWLAAGVLMVWCGTELMSATLGLVAVGNAIIVLGALGIAIYLWRNGQIDQSPDPGIDSRAFIECQIDTLNQQSKLLRMVPYWYVGPLALGALVRMIGGAVEEGKFGAAWGVTLVIVLAVFIGVVIINLRTADALSEEAKALQKELD